MLCIEKNWHMILIRKLLQHLSHRNFVHVNCYKVGSKTSQFWIVWMISKALNDKTRDFRRRQLFYFFYL